MIQNCCICGNVVTQWVKSLNAWSKWCSSSCRGKDPEILEKKRQTNQRLFGGHPMHNQHIISKRTSDCIEKYGVANCASLSTTKEKIKQTFLKNYGVENPSFCTEVKNKISQKAKERYRTNKEGILKKRRATSLENFGFESNKFKHILPESLLLLNNISWLKEQHYANKKSLEAIAQELQVSATAVADRFVTANLTVIRHAESSMEKELISFLKENTLEVIEVHNRTILDKKEIDIFLPSLKLAIELNGVYWHSEEQGKYSSYHLEKTKMCEEQGIHLLHIYDLEWTNPVKQSIVKSKICHLLGKSTVIGARKCKVQEIDSATASNFLDTNHLQGSCSAKIKLGLYYNEQLCAVATFSKPRFNKQYDWELLRSAAKTNISVMGGLSKLLSYFVKNYKPLAIISYADRRWTANNSNVYNSAGFKFLRESAPNYKYFNPNKGTISLQSRNQFQKHMLQYKLSNFNQDFTEYENMKMNGYHRIWDCGNLVYLLTI